MVLGVYNQTIGIIVVIISVLAYFSVKQSLHYTNVYVNDENENKKILLISITSAQEHFEQRQAIRRTWVKLVNNEGLKHYFLIGKSFCMIPPQYRLSNLTCEEWKPALDTNATDESLFSSFTKTSKCFGSEEVNAYNSFSFILNHDIVLHQFGIKANILKICNKPLRLILLDAIALKKIVSATFIQNNNDKNKDENEPVIWKRVTKTVLPSGFEGKLLLEGECNFEEDEEENEGKEKSFSLQLNDRTNIVRFLQVFNNNSSSVYVNNICTDVGFTFSIKNTNYLHKIISERDKEYLNWETNVKKISNKLNNEINTYRDILLLDIVDVYRNLPMKMFHFYQWLNNDKNNYTYVLKTDDDVFVDIPNILKELELKENKEWNWWSCFRKNWPVQKAGKWRELHLNLTEYPTFPSGAGYVLHNNVIKYINKNTKKIFLNLQGEDVALGIWLNDFKPNMHYGSFCQWSCNSQCSKGACNVMELSVSTMYELWERYLTCNNSLNCWCN